jgi:hypothetical protein
MSIPGFTAEASVGKTPGNYQVTGTPTELVGNRGVVPQVSFCRGAFENCRYGLQGSTVDAKISIMWCDMYAALC